jgi:M6 family metalloprotease-like protein
MGSPLIVNPSLSGFFDAMSSNRGFRGWQLRGDVFPSLYITKHPTAYYQGKGGVGAVAEEVLKTLDQNINFADYDRYDPCDLDDDGNRNEPDGYADMIILWFRWICSGIDGSTYSGVCALGGLSMSFPGGIDTTNDIINVNGIPTHVKISPYAPSTTYSIASGLVAEGTTDQGIDIFAHEIGHYLFGLIHTQRLGVWDLMTGSGVGIMNSEQRSELGWIPDMPHYSTEYGTYNIHLHDFETMGEAYIFDGASERYILENRAANGFYSNKANWIMPGNGLLITNLHFNPGADEDPITVACADSKWNWANFGITDCGGISCMGLHSITFLYPFKKLDPSNNGYSVMEMHDLCTFDGTANACEWLNGCSGQAGNLWNVGYNQVFSQWSNPKTYPASNKKGISIELVSQNPDGSADLIVKFGVDNCEAGTPPSKPLNLSASKYYFDPSKPTLFHPQIKWMRNNEPDVINPSNPGKYNIYRGFVAIPKTDPPYVLIQSVSFMSNSFIDNDISLYDPGNSYGCAYQPREYAYRITVTDNENLESVRSERSLIDGFIDPCAPPGSDKLALEHPFEYGVFNYPNPFNPVTAIKYFVPYDSYVSIRIFNALGQEVVALVNNEFRKAGSYSVTFDGTNYASGIYFYQLSAGTFTVTKKMLLIK